jgi:hypothetical protein
MRATFAEPFPSPAVVSVEFQAVAGTTVRMRLYSEINTVVGEAVGIVPSEGRCSPGSLRGRTVTVASSLGTRSIAYVKMWVNGNSVWVIDHFIFTADGIVPTEPATWGKIKALYYAD